MVIGRDNYHRYTYTEAADEYSTSNDTEGVTSEDRIVPFQLPPPRRSDSNMLVLVTLTSAAVLCGRAHGEYTTIMSL